MFYGFRYYSSELGQWACRDPIAERGGLNLYGFVRSAPTYRVDVIGWYLLFGTLYEENQCYAYAMNDMRDRSWWDPSHQSPGVAGGYAPLSIGHFTCSDLMDRSVADGIASGGTVTTTNCGSDCSKPGEYKVEVVKTVSSSDFHFYKQEDGQWTHKLGEGVPTNLDASANPITDPATCDRTYSTADYSVVCGCLCVKKSCKTE